MIVFGRRSSPPAVTEVALTTDFDEVERARSIMLEICGSLDAPTAARPSTGSDPS